MTTSGPNFGTGSNLDRGGSAWEDPTNINEIGGDEATTNAYYSSDYLVCKNLGFAIPASAIITDVSFTYLREAYSEGKIQDDSIVLCDGGNNVADTSYWDYETITKHGGNAYWGVTLTPTMVNSANFGLKISAKTSTGGNIGAIGYVTCTVTYTIFCAMSLGSWENSPKAIIDEAAAWSEVKTPQWMRKYYAWAAGKL